MARFNYKNYSTRELVEIWCYNSNNDAVEQELESRGFDLTAENVQMILLFDEVQA